MDDDVCPKCYQTPYRPSMPSGVIDSLSRLVLLGPYRCEMCLHRFYRFTWPWAGPWERSKFHYRRHANRMWAGSLR